MSLVKAFIVLKFISRSGSVVRDQNYGTRLKLRIQK